MGAGGSCCNGARDDERMVTKLDLSHCGWTEVPPAVYQVERYIETLNLSHNRILSLPPQLFHCQELKHINLIDNGLDSLPPAIGSLLHLVSLKLDKNCIKDLPENLKNCRKLKRLSLSNNHIQQLPNIVTQLINLEELFLNDCDLTFLPASVGRLTKLKILELRNNRLGNLPLSMSRLTSLTRLDLGDNSLQVLPECTSNMISLQELLLDNNDLETISGAGLKKLEHLDVSYNNLRTIGKEISQCTSLTLLNLGWNYLESIPETISSLTKLEILNVEMNELSTLPRSLGKLVSIEELNVANNRLCDLPPTIGLLRHLVVFNLSRNYVQELPCEIGSCTKLSIMNASYNRLQSLPSEVGYLNNLKVLDVVGNFLMYLPISMSNLTGLRAIWLSANQNVPLIPFTEDVSVASGERFLTNIALPQLGETALPPPEQEPVVEKTSWRRKIRFEEDEDILPGRLDRTPTPFPKELRCPARKQQRQEDNYVNLMDGKVAIFQQATQQPPSMLNYSDSSVTMIKEANIRRRHSQKTGVDEATETEPYFKEFDDQNCQPVNTPRQRTVTIREPEEGDKSSSNLEGDENNDEKSKDDLKSSEGFPNQRQEAIYDTDHTENQETLYTSNTLQCSRMSPINEEGSPQSQKIGMNGFKERDSAGSKCEPVQAHDSVEGENDGDIVDTPSRLSNDHYTVENRQGDANWNSYGVNRVGREYVEHKNPEGGYANAQWDRRNIGHNGVFGGVSKPEAMKTTPEETRREYVQDWNGDGGINEKRRWISGSTKSEEFAERQNYRSGVLYSDSGSDRQDKCNEEQLKIHEGNVWPPPDVTVRGMTPHFDLSGRYCDRVDVESVDSFESDRLRGSMVEPMELSRNQVIYSNLKNGNMYPQDSRSFHNPVYLTPPHPTYVNSDGNVPYSSIPVQLERVYGQNMTNGALVQPLSMRQSAYGTLRQSDQDSRNSPATPKLESQGGMSQQYLIRQSPYGTIRQSPYMENGNIVDGEMLTVRQEGKTYNHPQSFPIRQSPSGVVRQSPRLENGNLEMERPPSKQEMLDIAERNRRENIKPPCYEIAKLYSTKAAMFENRHSQGHT